MTARSRGVALVAVLWMLAALSLLAYGLVNTTRASLRVTGVAQDFANAEALGDGAIQLAVRDLAAAPPEARARLTVGTYTIGGRSLAVQVIPSAGLINLNRASVGLLVDLLSVQGGMDASEARQLAYQIDFWRTRATVPPAQAAEYLSAGLPPPRAGPFECKEDLLQVLGMRLDIFDRIQNFISVYEGSQGVNPLAAPAGVLLVLSKGDRALAAQLSAQRETGKAVLNTMGLEHVEVNGRASDTYRIDADLTLEDGRHLRRSRWISLSKGGGGLPFRTLSVLPVQALSSDGGEA